MPPTTQQRQDAGRQLGRDLDIENDTRRESGLAPLTTRRTPQGTQVVETGSVPASSLAAPVSRVNVPAPVENIVPPAQGIDAVRDNLTFDIQEFRTNQAQERENFQQLQALGGGESFIDARTRLTQESGMVANQTRLQDIQTQLAGLSSESLGTRINIASEAGATGATSQRAISAEQAKNNVRSFGLAAEASILQGNIESARTFVNDAMTTIYQDRQLGRQNLIDQNNALSNILDPQRAEILMQDNRRYEEEIAATQRVQSAVDLAMQSGATADDVKKMTDPTLTDEDRLATAQGIVSRGATQDRALDIAQQEASIRASNASADAATALQEQREAETNLLENPSQSDIDAEVLDVINGLDGGTRETITGARETVGEIDRMIAIIETVDDITQLNFSSELGREFNKLKENVVDKLARERTGAVVGVAEQKTFEKIVGVRMIDTLMASDAEQIQQLNSLKNKHNESLSLADPTNEVRDYLDSLSVDDEDFDAEWNTGAETSTNIEPAGFF